MNAISTRLILALTLPFFVTEGHTAPLVIIETVAVADPANASDPRTGYGAVSQPFVIGKYEVTLNQYIAFLNAVATRSDPLKPWLQALYHAEMGGYKKIGALITRTGEGSLSVPYVYQNAPGGDGNRPVPWVSWFDCARFANWMHNGAVKDGETEQGAYALKGRTTGYISKQPKAKWWIPSEDEWYKAAFYDPATKSYSTWPTRSVNTLPLPCGGGSVNAPNSANYNLCGSPAKTQAAIGGLLTPVGTYVNSPSYYGTFDQAGNVWEWTSTKTTPSMRIIRGGSWSNGILTIDVHQRRDYPYEPLRGIPAYSDDDTGFRLAGAIDTPPR